MYLPVEIRKELNNKLIQLNSKRIALIELFKKETDLDKIIDLQKKISLINDKIEFTNNRIINKPRHIKYREKTGKLYL